MITTTTLIVFAFVLVGFVFYSREQYTTYPGVNERRLNTIKQLSDDVLQDLQKMSPTGYTTPTTAPPVYNPNVYAQQPIAPQYVQQPTTTPQYVQQPTTPSPTSGSANIPSWVHNLTSTAAAQQLTILNPGYTVERVPTGGAMTRDYRVNRIRVTYGIGDRVISISQG
jgi:hypothetical protein